MVIHQNFLAPPFLELWGQLLGNELKGRIRQQAGKVPLDWDNEIRDCTNEIMNVGERLDTGKYVNIGGHQNTQRKGTMEVWLRKFNRHVYILYQLCERKQIFSTSGHRYRSQVLGQSPAQALPWAWEWGWEGNRGREGIEWDWREVGLEMEKMRMRLGERASGSGGKGVHEDVGRCWGWALGERHEG